MTSEPLVQLTVQEQGMCAQDYSMQVYRVYTETAALCDVGDVCCYKREPATLIKQEARPDS